MPAKKDIETSQAIDLAARGARGASSWSPRPSDPVSAAAAIALSIALLRALRDRGVLSPGEIDEILAEAGGHFTRGPDAAAFSYLIEQVRADLERTDIE